MGNKWLEHIAKFRKSHPNLSMKQALRQGKKTYTKVGKTTKSKVKKKVKKKT